MPSSSALKAVRAKSASDAKAVVKSGSATLESIAAALSSLPYESNESSKAESDFAKAMTANGGADAEKPNDAVDGAYAKTRDLLALACDHSRKLERFLGLHHPQMEDGNNFGVTVQMTVAKYLSDCRDSWTKSLAESSKYYSSRADALDKFTHLPKTSVTETSSSSKSDGTGGKDGPKKEENTSTSTETKKTSQQDAEPNAHRIKALAALDAQAYGELRAALDGLYGDYAVLIDNFEKNMEKLEMPKGSGYTAGMGGSSMVY